MSEASKEKSALVPRLRFPQFSEAWRTDRVGKIAEIFKGKGIAKSDISNDGIHSCIRYGELYTVYGELVTKVLSRTSLTATELFFGEPNDVIIPSSGETKEDIATAACVVPGGIAFGSDLNVLRTKENGAFLSYYLNGPLRKDIARVAQGDSVVHLYPHQIEKLPIAVPVGKEQQKIADCLSSLDELITAETQKLDALKTHKKGLMQQLFPREGETVPRLRFPEFREAVAWEKHPVSGMLEEALRPVKMNNNEDYTLVTVKRRYGGIVLREVLKGEDILVKSQFRIKKNDFLISKRQIVHCACGAVPEAYDGAIVSNEYTILQSRKNCDISFFGYFSQQPIVGRSFLECSVGIVIEKMLFKQDQWLKKKFLFPRLSEQRKIANCLSFLDDLITAQSQKIDALKAHKKGLMQQLFPVLDEVPA